MKLRSFIITFTAFFVLGIILLVAKQTVAGTISLAFAVMIGISFITLKVMERNKIKKLDDVYYVLTKEALLKEYDKLAKEFAGGKIKSVILTYLKFKKEYSKEELKRFGLWLTKTYTVDPSGIDGGIVVLFVNIHELMMKELVKYIKEELKKADINVDFDYGYAVYEENVEYEVLKQRAIKTLQQQNR